MARLVAIEWDAKEARIVAGRSRGKEVVFEHAFSVELERPEGSGGKGAAREVHVGEQIGAALAARGIGHGEVLVALGRASIELRQLMLPPCPPDELPDMVRFQAMRQFANIGEQWPLDFVPIKASDSDNVQVLAAAISPTLLAQIRKTCEAAELTPECITLRAFAAASLLRRRGMARRQQCRLLVDMLAEEVDLTVMLDDQVAFVRTVRLSQGGEPAEQDRALVAEIRRTMVAAQNQLNGRRAEQIFICGDAADHQSLKELLEESLALPVELLDPLAGLAFGGDLAERKPPHPGRYAPLFGLLLDEASTSRHDLDFLHPRQRPKAASQRQRYIRIGVLAAAVLLMLAGLLWYPIHDRNQRIEELRRELQTLNQKEEPAVEIRQKVTTVEERFLYRDITWLEELRYVAENLPPADDLILDRLQLQTLARTGGGEMTLTGFGRQLDIDYRMQQQLRDERRRVTGSGTRQQDNREVYPFQVIGEKLIISPEDHSHRMELLDDDPLEVPVAEQQAADDDVAMRIGEVR